MSGTVTQQAGRGLAPLALRLAVAGILGYSGLQTFRHSDSAATPIDETAPAAVDNAAGAATTAQPTMNVPATSDTAADSGGTALTEDDSGMWVEKSTLVGGAEMGFAAILLVGFLTRLATLMGLAGITTGGLAAHSVVATVGPMDQLVEIYNQNPLAVMLLGAVCLSLLISGAGSASFDRMLFGRKQAAGANLATKSI